MNTFLKRALIAMGTVLAISAVFVSPCVSRHPVAPTTAPQEHTECDSSCPLPAGVPAQPQTKLVSQENWQFTLPGVDWASKESPAPDIKVALMGASPEHSVLILFVKEGTDGTFADYVIGTIRSFAMLEFKINSVKQVVINDQKFVLVQVSKDGTVIWSWLSLKGQFGYAFTCGADVNVDAGSMQHDLCTSIAETVQIQ